MRLRRRDSTRDLERIAALLALVDDDPPTVEGLRDQQRRAHPAAVRVDVVAEVVPGKDAGAGSASVVGWAFAERDPWDPPGRFMVGVIVDPAHRRRGVGERLYRRVAAFAQARGATRLRSDVNDTQPQGVRFAEKHGFHAERHVFTSVLDLTAFDPSHFAGAIAAAEAVGFRFASLAELGDTPEHRRRLYDLNVETARDIPGGSGTNEPYDLYHRDYFERESYRPDGQWVALDTRAGHRWAGITMLAWHPERRRAHQEMTGVVRDYRGRGLALPLKVRALARAQQWGASFVTTSNDSLNAPMLAVNRRLGFERRSGYYKMYRDLPDVRQVVADGYDHIAERYASWTAHDVADDVRARYLEVLFDRVPPGGAVLDLGCGGGGPTTAALAARYALTGVDISERQIERSRGALPHATFLRADMTRVDFPPASFDAVVSFYAFLHLPHGELAPLLERVAGWLRPGGLLVATMAGGSGGPGTIEEDFLGAPMYFSGYSPEENRTFLERAGLEIEALQPEQILEDGKPVSFLWAVARKSSLSR